MQCTRSMGIGLTVMVVALTSAGCSHDDAAASAAAGNVAEGPAGGAAATSSAPVSGTFTGLYVDLNEGSMFTECETDRRWWVQAGGAAEELDGAYLAVRSGPGQAVRVTVVAHSAPGTTAVSAGGDGAGKLIIDKVVILAGETVCPGQKANALLTGTTWRVVELKGRALAPEDGTVTLRLEREEKTIRAYTGCRVVTGSFQWTGTALTFGSVDVAVNTCAQALPATIAMDAAMLDVLRTTGSYRIAGDTLGLMGEDGVLARLVAEG